MRLCVAAAVLLLLATAPLAQSRPLRIGITCFIDLDSPFLSQKKQTAFYVYDLLKRKEHLTMLIDLGPFPLEQAIMLEDAIIRHDDVIASFDMALQQNLDVVIEVARLSQNQLNTLHALNIKVISYRPHNDYDVFHENVLYNRSSPHDLFTAKGYDMVFVTPGTKRSSAFYQLVLSAPVTEVPLVWNSRLVDKVWHSLKRPTYSKRPDKNAVAVMEPNSNLGRMLVIPLTMIELVYRQQPNAFSEAYINNAEELRTNSHIKVFATNQLSSYHTGRKVSFEGRYRSLWFMSEFAEVAVAHQLDSPNSYFALEMLYAGWPLVHNIPFLKDCGYYYEDCDGRAGAEQLLKALNEHNDHVAEYNSRARKCAERFMPVNETLYAIWESAIQSIVAPADPSSSAAASSTTPRQNEVVN